MLSEAAGGDACLGIANMNHGLTLEEASEMKPGKNWAWSSPDCTVELYVWPVNPATMMLCFRGVLGGV